MYTTQNFKTKKALKEALAGGRDVGIYQPNDFMSRDFSNFTGTVYLEGPHYPKPHRWYAKAEVEQGKVVKIL